MKLHVYVEIQELYARIWMNKGHIMQLPDTPQTLYPSSYQNPPFCLNRYRFLLFRNSEPPFCIWKRSSGIHFELLSFSECVKNDCLLWLNSFSNSSVMVSWSVFRYRLFEILGTETILQYVKWKINFRYIFIKYRKRKRLLTFKFVFYTDLKIGEIEIIFADEDS